MDFAATVDMKNLSTIHWKNYPITSGKFYESRGSLEPVEVKKSLSFPTPDATVIVILHKDHKVYYSAPTGVIPGLSRNPDSENMSHTTRFLHTQEWQELYIPFSLPPSLSRDTRTYVQSYFREKYGLELSVRPAHKKWISEDGKPYLTVNAQIQTGTYEFSEYSKSEAKTVLSALW